MNKNNDDSKNNYFFTDPVCRMKVNILKIENTTLFSTEHNGKKYYFCSPFCTAAFLDNPERYITNDIKEKNDTERNSL